MRTKLKPSDSSRGLDSLVKPLDSVALVIVHVNEHYGSLSCCSEPVKRLIQSRVARHVYEHSAWNESFLQTVFGVEWNPQKRQRYTDFDIDGVNYHIVDNETDQGNYHIDGLQGRRLVVVGGAVGRYCHGLASAQAFKQLYESLKTDKIREVHLPADCVYETYPFGDPDEDEMVSNIIHNHEQLTQYAVELAQARRSYFVSVDKKVVEMDCSVEEPTLHLAVWTNSDDMFHYLRNDDRLVLKKTG